MVERCKDCGTYKEASKQQVGIWGGKKLEKYIDMEATQKIEIDT
jgi:hypothetical protein